MFETIDSLAGCTWCWLLIPIGVALTLGVLVFSCVGSSCRATAYGGKHVVITGGSTGLGRATAIEFARRGAHVTIVARRREVLDEAVVAIEAARLGEDQHVTALAQDVTQGPELAAAIQGAAADVGPVDVLIVCAGQSLPALAEDQPVSEYEEQLQVNFIGALNAMKAVLDEFIRRKEGHLVFVTSTLAIMGCPGYASYCASKFAVAGLVHCLAMELPDMHNIKVSIAYPPTMDTPGLEEENKRKPALTWAIEEEGSGHNDPADVARPLVNELSKGTHHITFDFVTWIQRVLMTGMSDRNCFCCECLLLPFLAVINAVALWLSFRVPIRRYVREHSGASEPAAAAGDGDGDADKDADVENGESL